MKKLIIFTTAFVLTVVFLTPAFLSLLIKMVPSGEQPGYGGASTLSVFAYHDFKQYFFSDQPNLTAVATSIKNPNLKNQKDVIFTLLDESGNMIREEKISGRNIGDGDFVKFIFDPIQDSKNKKYSFILNSPDASEEEVLQVFIISPTDQVLEYEYQDEVHPGGVPMVTYSKPASKLSIIKSVYSTWISKLF